ncbi:hypothetical protein N4T77_18980 [Clostridium sp. CX1]|uniref:hypothetical protein n=1 Tax=Clostridium sp. CX1 TaxID=2978346 RepID=UPI0021C06328|nr:hypothetical protein [Clostridium sp. CX1]MCT8978678.1 hypothetical protein [Clostridium sp. CX1]
MKFMVLDKRQGWGLYKAEVYEKSINLVNAIREGDMAVAVEKAIDNIMVSLEILDKASNDGVDVQQVLHRYNKRLINAGKKYKSVIDIRTRSNRKVYENIQLEEVRNSRGWEYQQLRLKEIAR